METTIEDLRIKLRDGYQIKWVGYHSKRHIWVHIIREGSILRHILYLKEDYTEDNFQKLSSSSATEPMSNTGTIWSSDSRLELLRLASILGINIGGSCYPGCGKEFSGQIQCVMAYDIESDRSRIAHSSFGSLSESILSIATYCSCHEKAVFSILPNVDFEYVLCKDSRDTVSKFIQYVKYHSPQWLLGYNNFGYDNTRIAYHSDADFDSILIPMRIGSGSSLTYAFYIDIEGVYNADLLTYLDKTRRSAYPNMRLDTLAKHHKVTQKIDFDTSDVRDFQKLFEYNIQDCKVTMELAFKSGALSEIVSICTAACVPEIDAVRFVSGTFASCSVASYCLQKRISMDWSPCRVVQEYKGAEVLKPMIGVHENVTSCDFSSMYPTILIAANISIENCRVTESTLSEGSTWKSSKESNFVIGGKRIAFDTTIAAVLPPITKGFVDTRKKVKYTDPDRANGLKTAGNSIYGSTGDRNSRIYSPMCSAAITTGGRWCLALAESILKKYGFLIVYGDTDSCLVARTQRAKYDISLVLQVLSQIFLYTPFPGMKMELERTYRKIAFLGKKTYFGVTEDGTLISKGMSKSRKDRIGVCRTLGSYIVPLLLYPADKRLIRTMIADMLSVVIDRAVTKSLTLGEVSKIVKKGGSNYFEFVTINGQRDTLECEANDELQKVPYSPKEICRLIVRETKSLFNVTSMGSFAYILKQSSVL